MTLSAESDTSPPGAGQEADAPARGFDVRTLRCDATRASIAVSGDLDAAAAEVLAQVIDSHLRAGRRFLRLNVGGLRSLAEPAVQMLAAAHERLLAARGTIILTGVRESVEQALRAAAPASPLLVLPSSAAE